MPPILSKQIICPHQGRFVIQKFCGRHAPGAQCLRLSSSLVKSLVSGRLCSHSNITKKHIQDATYLLRRTLYVTSASRQNIDRPSSEGKDKDEGRQEPPRTPNISPWFLLVNVIVTAAILLSFPNRRSEENVGGEVITWTQFVNDYLKRGEVETVYVTQQSDNVFIKLYPGAMVNGKPADRANLRMLMDPSKLEEKVREVEQELGIPSSESLKIVWKDFSLASAVIRLTVFLIFATLVYSIFKGMRTAIKISNPFESLSKAKYTRGDIASASIPKIQFKDIAGMHQAKVEIKEYVQYLKDPSRFQNLGARIPRGALLTGPPGCGKTLLAKAVATESEVPFLVMAGSDFVEMIGGLGASRVRQLFKDARSLKPCIIYIDEIDALGRSRSDGDGAQGGFGGGGGSESEHTLNQLLVEMDGMTDNAGVIMLASTNRADVLDKALLRPGRFDRHISIDLPTLSERKELFIMYLKQISLAKPIGEFSDYLAQATPGMSGADIANVCNEAALRAAREANPTVTEADLAYALDRILAGQARTSNSISKQEKNTIAYHECGHVLVSWLLKHTDALLKVSIIPRTGAALGFAQYMPSDKKLYSREALFEMMCVALGGRAAETVVFNRITTGAQNDLEKVQQLANNQIKRYGMGSSIGLLSFPADPEQDFQPKPYSKHFQQLIDQEAQTMVAQAYKTAEKLIIENRDKLDKLCEILLKQEEMTYDDVKAAIGAPPYGEKNQVDMSEQLDVSPAKPSPP